LERRVLKSVLCSGGHSRIGQSSGASIKESMLIVKKAVDSGINLIDTAEIYNTEEIVGNTVKSSSNKVYISTKTPVRTSEGKLKSAADIENSLDGSLRRLKADCVDIYHMHGVLPEDYEYVRDVLSPALDDLKRKGKLRFIGITERFELDTKHKMLKKAVQDDYWDVFMAGFNLLNQSARNSVLKPASIKNTGILGMFAVRRALAAKESFAALLHKIPEYDLPGGLKIDMSDPLGFLQQNGIVGSYAEAAYRFCAGEPGIHSVLSGTGKPAHLEENVSIFAKGPLPEKVQVTLKLLFEGVDTVTGD